MISTTVGAIDDPHPTFAELRRDFVASRNLAHTRGRRGRASGFGENEHSITVSAVEKLSRYGTRRAGEPLRLPCFRNGRFLSVQFREGGDLLGRQGWQARRRPYIVC